MILTQDLRGEQHAEQTGKGEIVSVHRARLESDKHENSFARQRDPGLKFGVEVYQGDCTIEIHVGELMNMCYRALRNKNMRSQQGPVRVKFSGTRWFREEGGAQ